MRFSEVMKLLEGMGTVQNRRIYERHGAGDPQFGVSFANLRKLQKKIKKDQELAEKLWQTGNSDAQSLAILITDPQKLTQEKAERWVQSISYYLLTDLLSDPISQTPYAKEIAYKWIDTGKEYIMQCGYNTLGLLVKDPHLISDSELTVLLSKIKKELKTSPNRARHAMNNTLIAIGIYRETIQGEVFKTAKEIGKVEVDHGETGCKTPEAISYIQKSLDRKKSKK